MDGDSPRSRTEAVAVVDFGEIRRGWRYPRAFDFAGDTDAGLAVDERIRPRRRRTTRGWTGASSDRRNPCKKNKVRIEIFASIQLLVSL